MTTKKTISLTPAALPLDLGDGLQLRFATPADNQQLVDLSFRVLDEADDDTPAVQAFMEDFVNGKFPLLRHDDFTIVEDTQTGKLVSSMCLMSETWRYGGSGGAVFNMGRPELVMTHEDYRRRGLIRKQFEVLHALSAQRGEVMQCITGIPSLYRMFGYELALSLGGGYRIYKPMFPPLRDAVKDDFRLRKPESPEDRAFIRQLHEAYMSQQLFAIEADDAIWENEFDGYADGSDGKFDWALIENKAGERLGYVNYSHLFWGATMNIYFVGLKPGVGYLNLLPHLLHGLYDIAQHKLKKDSFKHPAEEITGLYLRVGQEHPLYKAIGVRNMVKVPPYAWYIRVPDIAAYLRQVKPALESHLANSCAAGYTGELKLNFYHSGVHMKFESGKITALDPWQPPDGSAGHAHFPGTSFLYLLCGRHTTDHLLDTVADCFIGREAKALLDCLFPPFTGHVWVVGGGG